MFPPKGSSCGSTHSDYTPVLIQKNPGHETYFLYHYIISSIQFKRLYWHDDNDDDDDGDDTYVRRV